MILRSTELDVGNICADLCTRNILDQKSSIFEPRTCIKRETKIFNAH